VSLRQSLADFLPILTWLISGALTVLDWAVLRTTFIAIAEAINRAVPIEQQIASGWRLRWIIPAVDRLSIFVLGVVALGLFLGFDALYRAAAEAGKLKQRFITVTAVQVAVFVVCSMILFILQ
jgi:hypothetical protein